MTHIGHSYLEEISLVKLEGGGCDLNPLASVSLNVVDALMVVVIICWVIGGQQDTLTSHRSGSTLS